MEVTRRSFLYKELAEWYSKHPQSSKKRRSTGRAVAIADIVVDSRFRNVDSFVLLDPGPSTPQYY